MVQRKWPICVTDRKENPHKTAITLKNPATTDPHTSGETSGLRSKAEKNEGAIGAFTDNLGAEVPLIWMDILVYYGLSAPDAAGQCVTMSWLYSLA